jgi:hypothetical protein
MNVYLKAALFWFVLLAIALVNAIIRDATYVPALEPSIGMWAHQIGAIFVSVVLFIAIFLFLRHQKVEHSVPIPLSIGLMWVLFTVIFETFLGIVILQVSLQEVLSAYYFWNGELWVVVLVTMMISAIITDTITPQKS